MPFLAGMAAGGGDVRVGVGHWASCCTRSRSLTLKDSFYGFLNGVASGVLITVLLPYVERGFNVVTELSLLELVDLNKPMLRRLALEAPGTYNHSLFVGNLADARGGGGRGEQDAGARGGLLPRHRQAREAGVLRREHRHRRQPRHYNLSPTMSALVIISHVKDARGGRAPAQPAAAR